MSDEQSPTTSAEGQAAGAPWSQGQAPTAPEPQSGQATAPQSQDQGQAPSTPATDEPTFFDASNLPPELMATYKQMQGAFTTKTQQIARERQKIEAYDAFMRDPVGQIQALARQYGLNLTRADAAQVAQNQQQDQEWQPNSWDEVTSRIKDAARQEIMQELAPMLGQVQQMRAASVEQQLATIDPNWKEYEGNMRDLLNRHPSLVNDVSGLYRLAVPPEILEGRAIQQALKKYEEKAQHQKVASGGPAPKSSPATPEIKSFDDAVNAARQQILSGR